MKPYCSCHDRFAFQRMGDATGSRKPLVRFERGKMRDPALRLCCLDLVEFTRAARRVQQDYRAKSIAIGYETHCVEGTPPQSVPKSGPLTSFTALTGSAQIVLNNNGGGQNGFVSRHSFELRDAAVAQPTAFSFAPIFNASAAL